MEAGKLRDRYSDMLIEWTRGVRYPSNHIMDRTEQALTDRKRAEDYVEILIEKADTRHPSLHMLDRINRVIFMLQETEPEE